MIVFASFIRRDLVQNEFFKEEHLFTRKTPIVRLKQLSTYFLLKCMITKMIIFNKNGFFIVLGHANVMFQLEILSRLPKNN